MALSARLGAAVNQLYYDASYRLMTAQFNWTSLDLMLVAWGGEPLFAAADTTIAAIKARGFVELGFSLDILGPAVDPTGIGQTGQVLLPGIAVGETITWFTMCERQTTHDQSKLILYVDEALNLPFEGNGLDVVVQPDWLEQRGWFRP
jgi:hypothetical protein